MPCTPSPLNDNESMSRALLASLVVLIAAPTLLASSGCEEDLLTPPTGTTFTDIYTSSTFGQCADCHSPTAPGFTAGTEATQDWSSESAAFSSLRGVASGLEGNFAACNGVPLVGTTASESLLVATLDPSTRASFSDGTATGCVADAIKDHTLDLTVSAADLATLRTFIDEGGFD